MTSVATDMEKAATFNWFHAIDLGEFQTCGRFPEDQKQNQTLFPVFDLLQNINLNGMSCLDVGAAHGLLSFGMKMKGAAYVACTDIMDSKSPPFAFAQRKLGLEIDYKTSTPISEINKQFSCEQFDLVVCAGVFYHMLNPFEIFANLRKLLKKDGFMIVETAFEPHSRDPIMYFNSEKTMVPDIYTYWVPSASAVAGMAKLAGLTVLATRMIHTPDRIAFLLKLVEPKDVQHRTQLTKKMHETGLQDPALDLSPRTGQASTITYNGATDTQLIDVSQYEPNFPPHPNKMTVPVGKGVWISRNNNL